MRARRAFVGVALLSLVVLAVFGGHTPSQAPHRYRKGWRE